MMHKYLTAFVLSTLAMPTVFAQSVPVPDIKEGDSWVYNVIEERSLAGAMSSSSHKVENSIVRVGSKNIAVAFKPTDSNLPPKEQLRNLDWSLTENVNGKLITTAKPFDFPLAEGKKWTIEFTKENLSPKVKAQKSTLNYTVLGWQDVSTPAGNFHALKIEVDTEWTQTYNEVAAAATASVAAGQGGSAGLTTTHKAYTPEPVSGKTYEALWYAPEAKKYVKFIYESYQANGQLSKRTTEVLDSYKVEK